MRCGHVGEVALEREEEGEGREEEDAHGTSHARVA